MNGVSERIARLASIGNRLFLECCASLCDDKAMKKTAMATDDHESPWAFTFADRLGKALHVSGVSNQAMADALGVSRTTISNYTSGRTAPSKLQLKEWALKTGAPLEWLKTGIDPTENPHQSPDGGSEPPAGIEPATFALQGSPSGELIDMFAWKKAS